MLSPQNIIRGFCKTTNPPKIKYLISLFRNEDLHIVACFTTSQERAGVPLEQIKHGTIKNSEGEVISYVFLDSVVVGKTLQGKDFKFPQQTVIRFDYCWKEDSESVLSSSFKNAEVVCKLSDQEYINLIYSMYQSDDTPERYKPYFENILKQLC